MVQPHDIRDAVRERYAARALTVLDSGAGCCGTSPAARCCTPESALYSNDETSQLPAGAVEISLGCGNPTALIDLHEGETVLDLGSGGGIDVLLSARRVGPSGKAYGLDMTDEMLAVARTHAVEAGATNVEFLKGHIEQIPLPDASIDVVISNCVINLSPDKAAVLKEVGRVLRPGGRFAVSDVIVQGSGVGEGLRNQLDLWAGCMAGALTEDQYRTYLTAGGLADVAFEEVKEYGSVPDPMAEAGVQRILSAFVRATKPAD